jgi:hypothetical protein
VAVTWSVAPWPGFGMEDLSVHGHTSLTCHHTMVDVYSSNHPLVVCARTSGLQLAQRVHVRTCEFMVYRIGEPLGCTACHPFWAPPRTSPVWKSGVP